jgi:beta-phosphoglucomutase family hydrolase
MRKIHIKSKYKGLIFDLDGTLADSMPVHLTAWQETGKKYGFSYSVDDLNNYAGKSGVEIVHLINEKQNVSLAPDIIVQEKETNFLENLHLVKPVKAVLDVFDTYYGKLPMAVGTGSFRRIALQILANIGIKDKVQHLVSADDVENHKPSPDTFLQCARLINIDPKDCLVFEDAELGFQAANNAFMDVIDVRPFYIDPK